MTAALPFLLAALWMGQAPTQYVSVADRSVPVLGTRSKADEVVLETAFGTLAVPAKSSPREEAPTGQTRTADPLRRTARTTWWQLEHDLAPARAALYRDELDPFTEWILTAYDLDLGRLRKRAPFSLTVFRSRTDFKRAQAEHAPEISEWKGRGFAEGVTGFYSPETRGVFLWDGEAREGGTHLEVLRHEVVHWANHLLSESTGIHPPTWFEEGTAVYFSTSTALTEARAEPEDHPGALALVLADLDAGRAYAGAALRATPYDRFRNREYAWGWALVRFLRRHRKGRFWEPVLRHLRTVSTEGGETASEARRFLRAVEAKDDATFDRTWHRSLRASSRNFIRRFGASPEQLESLAARKSIDGKLAGRLKRVGLSFADIGHWKVAAAYFEQALRGRGEDGELWSRLARCRARVAGVADDEAWPADALQALEAAVASRPLHAHDRNRLGWQRLMSSSPARAREALGLAFLLAGQNDDGPDLAAGALEGIMAAEPTLSLDAAVASLMVIHPRARPTIEQAHVRVLQRNGDWNRLLTLLEARHGERRATFDDRRVLAGLLKLVDRADEADAIYEVLLSERPSELALWIERVECLVALGQGLKAEAVSGQARRAFEADPRELAWLHQRLARALR